jgi:hypothetical protein
MREPANSVGMSLQRLGMSLKNLLLPDFPVLPYRGRAYGSWSWSRRRSIVDECSLGLREGVGHVVLGIEVVRSSMSVCLMHAR